MERKQKPECQQTPVRFGPKHYEEGELSPEVQKLFEDTYVKNEVIVLFPTPPSERDIREVEATLEKAGFKIRNKKKCSHCDIPIQLWQGDNLHSIVNADGVEAGAGPTSSNGVGEEYCLNFKNVIPDFKKDQYNAAEGIIDERKNKIVVAVLDTGVDEDLIDKRFLYNDDTDKSNSPCYPDVKGGWNFTVDEVEGFIGSEGFLDDNKGKHGTLVTQLIIDQFKNSKENYVKILPLKTHDKDGAGDLFRTICAIHFAISRKVDIINASWGLYYYAIEPIPYLKELIMKRLKDEGILFVAASGNIDEKADDIARKLYSKSPGGVPTNEELRNLEIHSFYPANLSRPYNNVITVTTTNGKEVSPRQNHSDEFVDLGIMADDTLNMTFKLPFKTASKAAPLVGSSFAAAIATGIIGSYCPANYFRSYNGGDNNKKYKLLNFLKNLPNGQPGKITTGNEELINYIIEGAWIK